MKLTSKIKLALGAGIFCFCSLQATAQNAYVKLGGGYNFGIGSTIAYKTTEHTSYSGTGAPTGSIEFERVNINHGKGGVFGGAFGYMFNNNIGFEVGVNYLAGSKNEVEDKETNHNTSFSQNAFFSYTRTTTSKSQMVLIQPSLVIATGLPKFNPYARIGLVIAKGSFKNTYSYSVSNGDNGETEDKYFGGIGLGLQSALGLNFSLNDKIGIYTEATFNNLTYAPEKAEVTKYFRNGEDLLSTLKTSEKETTFDDSQTVTSYSTQSPSEPGSAPRQRYTLNSVGLQAGIKFSF